MYFIYVYVKFGICLMRSQHVWLKPVSQGILNFYNTIAVIYLFMKKILFIWFEELVDMLKIFYCFLSTVTHPPHALTVHVHVSTKSVHQCQPHLTSKAKNLGHQPKHACFDFK